MKRIVPLNDILILRVIKSETVSAGGIALIAKSVEKSIRGEVMIPNPISYDRNGERRQPLVAAGDIVVMQSGSVGTTVAESPDGEEWLAVPEDCIYYIVRESNDASS